jgi:DNA-binding beta-propeller fold protein YncE
MFGHITTRRSHAIAIHLLFVISLLSLGNSRVQAQWLITDNSNNLYSYQQGSGAASEIGTVGPLAVSSGALIMGIDFSPLNGKLYALTTFNDNSLYTVNTSTAAATFVGSTGQSDLIEGDIAFDPSNGTLYAAYSGVAGSLEQELLTINTSTGLATIVGDLPSGGDVSGLAFDKSDNLWAVETGATSGADAYELLELNKSTGAVLNTLAMDMYGGPTLGIRFDAAGNLYMADDDDFYEINTSTGAATLIDTTGVDAAGLAYVSVPEPGSLSVLTALSLFGLARRRRGTVLAGTDL